MRVHKVCKASAQSKNGAHTFFPEIFIVFIHANDQGSKRRTEVGGNHSHPLSYPIMNDEGKKEEILTYNDDTTQLITLSCELVMAAYYY